MGEQSSWWGLHVPDSSGKPAGATVVLSQGDPKPGHVMDVVAGGWSCCVHGLGVSGDIHLGHLVGIVGTEAGMGPSLAGWSTVPEPCSYLCHYGGGTM